MILWLEAISLADLPTVGGKHASLGEMQRQLGSQGIRLAAGVVTPAGSAAVSFMPGVLRAISMSPSPAATVSPPAA